MRIIRFVDENGRVCVGQETAPGNAELCEGNLASGYAATGKHAAVKQLLAPVEPVNLFCIGLNYRGHANETNAPIPSNPIIFMKPTTAVIGPEKPIRLPRVAKAEGEVDYECELAVVIGREVRNVAVEEALDCVFGYTCANDISARNWQKNGGAGQWIRGKSFDCFCPLGPALVTADEIPNPQQLALKTTLNGEVMQQSTTADMIFPVAELISFLSRDTTLLPGTVIITGTPQGVGFTRQPPVWLRAGDLVEIEVEKIGCLRNPVVGPDDR